MIGSEELAAAVSVAFLAAGAVNRQITGCTDRPVLVARNLSVEGGERP